MARLTGDPEINRARLQDELTRLKIFDKLSEEERAVIRNPKADNAYRIAGSNKTVWRWIEAWHPDITAQFIERANSDAGKWELKRMRQVRRAENQTIARTATAIALIAFAILIYWVFKHR